jgi:peptide/nickel transport system substrate-binding protein
VSDPVPLADPHRVSGNITDTIWAAWEPLVQLDSQSKPEAMLAESWDLTPDLKQLKLNLRKGVTFHNGKPMTSADVKWNLDRVKDPKLAVGQLANMAAWWTGVETPDANTIILKSDVSRPTLWDFLDLFNITEPSSAAEQEITKRIVGTGPFTFGEYRSGDRVKMLKNKGYWQQPKPYLDEIEFVIIPDQQAMSTQLEAGALEIALGPSLRDTDRLGKDARFKSFVGETTGWTTSISVNMVNGGPGANKLVRQGLHHAMDRNRYVDAVVAKTARRAVLPWTPQSPPYEKAKDEAYPFDLDKAKSLFTQAGFPTFTMEFAIRSEVADMVQFIQLYQSDLAKIGVTLQLKTMESAAYLTYGANREFPGLFSVGFRYGNHDPSTGLSTSRNYNFANNYAGFKNEKYEQLIEASATETNPARRRQVHSDLNDLLLDEAFCLALSSLPPRVLSSNKVNAVAWNLHESLVHRDIWMS